MVRSLFGNSNRKFRSTFWGSPFIPVGTNQTECCLPLTNFSVPSRFQTHARQIRPSFGFKPERIWHFYGKLVNRLLIAYHYAFDTAAGFFCQMVSTLGVKVVRFLKTSRNSTYQRGLHKWRGRCVFKILPNVQATRVEKGKIFTSPLFIIGQIFPVIFAFSRWRWAKATRTGVTNSTIAEDIWFNYLYLKLRFTFACTN